MKPALATTLHAEDGASKAALDVTVSGGVANATVRLLLSHPIHPPLVGPAAQEGGPKCALYGMPGENATTVPRYLRCDRGGANTLHLRVRALEGGVPLSLLSVEVARAPVTCMQVLASPVPVAPTTAPSPASTSTVSPAAASDARSEGGASGELPTWTLVPLCVGGALLVMGVCMAVLLRSRPAGAGQEAGSGGDKPQPRPLDQLYAAFAIPRPSSGGPEDPGTPAPPEQGEHTRTTIVSPPSPQPQRGENGATTWLPAYAPATRSSAAGPDEPLPRQQPERIPSPLKGLPEDRWDSSLGRPFRPVANPIAGPVDEGDAPPVPWDVQSNGPGPDGTGYTTTGNYLSATLRQHVEIEVAGCFVPPVTVTVSEPASGGACTGHASTGSESIESLEGIEALVQEAGEDTTSAGESNEEADVSVGDLSTVVGSTSFPSLASAALGGSRPSLRQGLLPGLEGAKEGFPAPLPPSTAMLTGGGKGILGQEVAARAQRDAVSVLVVPR